MIISNGTRRSWKYRLRDLLILLVTWVGWIFLALQPWLNYLEAEGAIVKCGVWSRSGGIPV